ncbi:MAG: class I SAM-dependent methyltransferase [Myxococcota bacterium]
MSVSSRLAEKLFLGLCSRMKVGHLELTTPDGRRFGFGPEDSPTRADMQIRDPNLYYQMLSQGDWGVGWGFVERKWETSDPRNVALVFMLNEHVFRRTIRWLNALSPAMRWITRRNQRDQSREEQVRRRTIGECYDVGNDFFRWVLGPSMVYTGAIWPHPEATLEEAQENKLQLVTRKAQIEAHHSVLDLGCGWGTLADHIHRNTGAKVKGITLSRNQVEWARQHYPGCEFEYLDYENITGLYDRIVCVGLAEHAGRENLDDLMKLVSDHLVPGGRFFLHTMQSYDGVLMASATERWTSFASVAMPNGDTPSMSNLVKAAMNSGQMRILHTETYGVHYARTALVWRENTVRHREDIIRAYSEELYRTYIYSWSMGSAAFETGLTLAHIVFEKQAFGAPLKNAML